MHRLRRWWRGPFERFTHWRSERSSIRPSLTHLRISFSSEFLSRLRAFSFARAQGLVRRLETGEPSNLNQKGKYTGQFLTESDRKAPIHIKISAVLLVSR